PAAAGRVAGHGRARAGGGDPDDPAGRRLPPPGRAPGPAHRAPVLPAGRDAGAPPCPPGSPLVTPYEVAAAVVDPELRVVTIGELGILRSVEVKDDTAVATITPTYSGCPAMDLIRNEITAALRRAGWQRVEVVTQLSPPWTTDWITESGRAKLAAAGIAPPGPAPTVALGMPRREPPAPACPHCGAADTVEVSRFGATPCMSLWRCDRCREPFEHVKAF